MFPKRLALWCAAFLSLSLLALASVQGAEQEETLPAVAAVRANQPPSYAGPTYTHQDLADDIARAVWIKRQNDDAFFTELARQAAEKAQAAKKTSHRGGGGPARYGTGACGGNLPPCWVMMKESGGNINAYNPTGCDGNGCTGKWQCNPNTCSGTGTEEEQDAEAAALWDGGKGCWRWAACG